MSNFSKLDENDFLISVFKDGEVAFSDINVERLAIEIPEDVELTEFQYYIQKVGFYLVNTISWWKPKGSNLDFRHQIHAAIL